MHVGRCMFAIPYVDTNRLMDQLSVREIEIPDTMIRGPGPGLPSYDWLRHWDTKRVPASNSRRDLPWPSLWSLSKKSDIAPQA